MPTRRSVLNRVQRDLSSKPDPRGEMLLSDEDRRLIGILQEDGRLPFAVVARELDLPEKTVRRRVKELCDADVIEIAAVAHPAVLGYHVSALVGLRVDGSRGLRAVANDLAELPQIDYMSVTTGRFHILVEVLCRDMDELLHTFDEAIIQMPGVGHAEIFPYMGGHYYEPVYAVSAHKSGSRPQSLSPAREELDDVDQTIVRHLAVDGRMSFAELGELLGMSQSQVRKRVTKMIDKQVVRISAITNPVVLGYSTPVWITIRCAPGQSVAELAETLSRLPTIAYVVACAGRYDILAEGVCRDHDDAMHLLESEIRPLAGVERAEVMVVLDMVQRRPGPQVSRR
jgi:Lrp/AsnC family transcriptional regulator for asnA, asnC and gidA